jgi:hypothetical protein
LESKKKACREDKPGSFYNIPVTPHKILLCKDHHQLCTLFIFITKSLFFDTLTFRDSKYKTIFIGKEKKLINLPDRPMAPAALAASPSRRERTGRHLY